MSHDEGGRQLQAFEFGASRRMVRIRMVDDRPWFYADDVCGVLEVRTRDILSALDDDERLRDTIAGMVVDLISEPGLYSAILRSRKPEAKTFKRWVTHEVLPAIRRTGTYSAIDTPKTRGEALRLAAEACDRADAEAARAAAAEAMVAQLEPSAKAWDDLVDENGDWSIGDAAKNLSRVDGIDIGRNQLFAFLGEIGWAFRQDSHWTPYQAAVNAGRLCLRIQPFHYRHNGQTMLAAPQLRITPKGVKDLRGLLARRSQLVPAVTNDNTREEAR